MLTGTVTRIFVASNTSAEAVLTCMVLNRVVLLYDLSSVILLNVPRRTEAVV
jgi:hypothetical protein